jgi:hypothetical protein
MDGRGDNSGCWKEDIFGLDRAQIEFPKLTLAQVLQEMVLHQGTIVHARNPKVHSTFYTVHLFQLPYFLGVLE